MRTWLWQRRIALDAWWARQREIGTVRVYMGRVPRLYPGEEAHGGIVVEIERGRVKHDVEYRVTPVPGIWGWWLRTRYRLVGYGQVQRIQPTRTGLKVTVVQR